MPDKHRYFAPVLPSLFFFVWPALGADHLLLVSQKAAKVSRDYDTQGETSHIVTLSHDGRWAFVSNSRSATVSAIDLESGQVTLIPCGQRPEGSVLSRDGRRLYVANRDSHTISIIDTAGKKKVGEIPTGKGPVRIGISGDGKYLVYALHLDRKVGFADISQGRQVALVELDGDPVSLNISPDGQWALTAAQEEDTVYIISISERKLLRKFKVKEGAGPDPVVLVELP